MLYGLQMGFQPVNDGLKHSVIHQHLIFGMVHDVDQVFVEQPHINGVNNTAKANRAIPSRQMPMMVHCKGGNAIALLKAKTRKGLRQLTRLCRYTCPVGPLHRPIGPTGNDFARTMLARRVVNQMGNAKVPILHGAAHQILSLTKRRQMKLTYFLFNVYIAINALMPKLALGAQALHFQCRQLPEPDRARTHQSGIGDPRQSGPTDHLQHGSL